MSNLLFLVAAYAVVWVVLFAYLLFLGGAVRALRAEIAELRLTLAGEAHEPLPER